MNGARRRLCELASAQRVRTASSAQALCTDLGRVMSLAVARRPLMCTLGVAGIAGAVAALAAQPSRAHEGRSPGATLASTAASSLLGLSRALAARLLLDLVGGATATNESTARAR